MPEGMSADTISNALQAQLDRLKKRGAPKDLIAEMEQNISQQIESMQIIVNLAKSASTADKKFVEENISLLMQISSMTDDDM
jgi:hypothetical protein